MAGGLGEVSGALGYRFGQGMTAARKGWELAATLPTATGDDLRLLADRARRTARSVADQVMVAGGPLSPLHGGPVTGPPVRDRQLRPGRRSGRRPRPSAPAVTQSLWPA